MPSTSLLQFLMINSDWLQVTMEMQVVFLSAFLLIAFNPGFTESVSVKVCTWHFTILNNRLSVLLLWHLSGFAGLLLSGSGSICRLQAKTTQVEGEGGTARLKQNTRSARCRLSRLSFRTWNQFWLQTCSSSTWNVC